MRTDRNTDDRRARSEETTGAQTLISRAVHTRVDFGPRGEAATHATVFCNRVERSVAVERCEACSYFSSLAGTESDRMVKCRAAATLGLRLGDLAERATRTVLSEVGRRRFACLEPTASLDTIRSLLLDEGTDGLPVIDDAGHLIGMVSKAELLRRHRDRADDVTSRGCATHADVRVTETAADVMVPAAHALPEDAPLSFGIALLAVEELAQVPIVNEAGVVVGLFSSSDAVRWLALQMGYVVKPPGA